MLAIGALTPGAIAESFDSSRQTISKHIQILTECELLSQTQQGREIYYELNIKQMKEIDQWLEQFRNIWESQFDQLDKLLLTMQKNKK